MMTRGTAEFEYNEIRLIKRGAMVKMKKWSVCLMVVLIISIIACGSNDETVESSNIPDNYAQSEVENEKDFLNDKVETVESVLNAVPGVTIYNNSINIESQPYTVLDVDLAKYSPDDMMSPSLADMVDIYIKHVLMDTVVGYYYTENVNFIICRCRKSENSYIDVAFGKQVQYADETNHTDPRTALVQYGGGITYDNPNAKWYSDPSGVQLLLKDPSQYIPNGSYMIYDEYTKNPDEMVSVCFLDTNEFMMSGVLDTTLNVGMGRYSVKSFSKVALPQSKEFKHKEYNLVDYYSESSVGENDARFTMSRNLGTRVFYFCQGKTDSNVYSDIINNCDNIEEYYVLPKHPNADIDDVPDFVGRFTDENGKFDVLFAVNSNLGLRYVKSTDTVISINDNTKIFVHPRASLDYVYVNSGLNDSEALEVERLFNGWPEDHRTKIDDIVEKVEYIENNIDFSKEVVLSPKDDLEQMKSGLAIYTENDFDVNSLRESNAFYGTGLESYKGKYEVDGGDITISSGNYVDLYIPFQNIVFKFDIDEIDESNVIHASGTDASGDVIRCEVWRNGSSIHFEIVESDTEDLPVGYALDSYPQ